MLLYGNLESFDHSYLLTECEKCLGQKISEMEIGHLYYSASELLLFLAHNRLNSCRWQ